MNNSTEINRYFIKLAFDGTPFHGWQIQNNARSVQGDLNAALRTLLRTEIETIGCGRTDTGVHAKMFFAHFDHSPIEDPSELAYKLNAILPHEISIQSIFKTDPTAHARFSATARTYQYHVHRQKNPFVDGYSWYNQNIPDVEKLNRFVNVLMEYTDFTSFSKTNTQTFTNNCKITECYWEERSNSGLLFTITADRFLRNMVRAIVGTLVKSAEKEMNEIDFRKILESKSRSEAGVSVPAQGLFLTNIEYPFQLF